MADNHWVFCQIFNADIIGISAVRSSYIKRKELTRNSCISVSPSSCASLRKADFEVRDVTHPLYVLPTNQEKYMIAWHCTQQRFVVARLLFCFITGLTSQVK